ncbi:uncharacterized protein EDB91DRAFT_690277 [Suillus paluster]|uniref:uncharacterized protein n=1 Tax=Suillus paluster TaxID=48578 RepID=UPI001B8711A6|nr:uncharacterized protein EDB91DRAFT_690277 [Suillus paluster]KAG1750452.1 hypothetical protein EDB91DRAFT_690277 [Suillus paluster]
MKAVTQSIKFDFDRLRWKGPAESDNGTTKTQWFVVEALAAHIQAEKDAASVRALKDGENADDVLAKLDDGRAFLMSYLGLDNKAGPLSKYFV